MVRLEPILQHLLILLSGLVSIKDDSVTKLADYPYLKDQIGKINPSSVVMSAYTPTNTALQSCPAVNDEWEASSTLPPTPNSKLCSCMTKSLKCVAKSSVKTSSYGDLFSYTCADGICSGINGNGTTGVYGAFSQCNAEERLSWAMNAVSMPMHKYV